MPKRNRRKPKPRKQKLKQSQCVLTTLNTPPVF
nr:MAG TPA: hypothetical protein [Caudoviricetes sp.]